MQTTFKGYLTSSKTWTQTQIESAINTLNLDRLNKINKIMDYVKQQGFADGSGLGSLDHEMNRDGAGFMHALFLISDSLRVPSNKSKLLDLINTAKWYTGFGEFYQSPTFEFKGTTADRMIQLLLYRLMIVLVMPSDEEDESKAKIRDMDALVKWMENALTVNEGLGGVIKPDFTGFHHKAFYASAYVPQALHEAAMIQYLLGGTVTVINQQHQTRTGDFAPYSPQVFNSKQSKTTFPTLLQQSTHPGCITRLCLHLRFPSFKFTFHHSKRDKREQFDRATNVFAVIERRFY